jgi:hypothetical protein
MQNQYSREQSNGNSIAVKWIEAFNKHDLDALLSLYDDDANHYSPKLKIRQPETEGWVYGKGQLRQWWADAFSRLPSLQYTLTEVFASAEKFMIQYDRHVDSEGPMAIAEFFHTRNGLIIESRVYHG